MKGVVASDSGFCLKIRTESLVSGASWWGIRILMYRPWVRMLSSMVSREETGTWISHESASYRWSWSLQISIRSSGLGSLVSTRQDEGSGSTSFLSRRYGWMAGLHSLDRITLSKKTRLVREICCVDIAHVPRCLRNALACLRTMVLLFLRGWSCLRTCHGT